MADARLRDVREEILARIRAINGSAGGFTYAIKQSGEAPLPVDRVSSFPAAFVYVDGWSQEYNRMGDGPAAQRVRARVAVQLYTTGTTAQQDVVNWAQDVVRAVMQDPKHLGLEYVETIRHDGGEFRTSAELSGGWGQGKVTFEVVYTTARGTL